MRPQRSLLSSFSQTCLCVFVLVGCDTSDSNAPVPPGSGDSSAQLSDSGAQSIDSGVRGQDGGGRQDLDAAQLDTGKIADAAFPDSHVPDQDGQTTERPSRVFAYVGGWDWSGAAYPFRSFSQSSKDGAFGEVGDASDLGANPSFISLSIDSKLLYIANEYEGEKAGITVARLDPVTGVPVLVAHTPYSDGAFVHSSVHPSGRYLFAADYNGGRVVAFRLAPDGKVGAVSDNVAFENVGGTSAQTHSIGIHANGKWIYAPNKARNEIAQITFDPDTGKLAARKAISSSGGPRHIALRGNVAFVMYETDSHLASFSVDANGNLTEIVSRSTLPSDFKGTSLGAHVLVHPSGRFVYASNRGHDSIVVFATDESGNLTLVSHTPTQGKGPRDFDIDKEGRLLVVANQGNENGSDGSLVAFTIGDDGKLTQRGTPTLGLRVPTGVALVTRYQ